MAALTPIEMAALRLRNISPEYFNSFIAAVEKRVAEVTVAVIRASAGDILVQQGRAQAWEEMLRYLKECTIDRMKQEPAPPTPR